MKYLATGCACNLNDLFVRFPYEKCKSLLKLRTKFKKLQKIKQVFRFCVQLVLKDIIDNNITFKIHGIGYQRAEIHMEAFQGKDFEKLRKIGKFKDVDFLESLFTGYQIFLYTYGKRDNLFSRKKFPIYVGKDLKDKITEHTNNGKTYC